MTVADWVAANPSDVLAHYPSPPPLDVIPHAGWMDGIVGGFAVIDADTTGSNAVVVSRYEYPSKISWALYRFSDGRLYLGTNDSAPLNLLGGSIGTDPTTVGFRYDGTTAFIYVNGIEVGTVASPLPNQSTAALRVGHRLLNGSVSSTFPGTISDVVVLWAADASTIADLHDAWAGTPPPPPPPGDPTAIRITITATNPDGTPADMSGFQVTVTPESVTLLQPQSAVLLGDSFFASYPEWFHQGNADAQTRFLPVVNAGVGSETLDQMHARWGADVAPHAPTWVVLHGGVNDLIGFNADSATVIARFQAIMATAASDGVALLICTPPSSTAATSSQKSELAAVRSWLLGVSDPGVTVVDTGAALTTGDGVTADPALLVDSVHPNAAGVDAMAQVLTAAAVTL